MSVCYPGKVDEDTGLPSPFWTNAKTAILIHFLFQGNFLLRIQHRWLPAPSATNNSCMFPRN